MKDFIRRWLKYIIFICLFSFFINLLYLTFPIYMLSIYDRVLQSYSMPTLLTLTVGALFALCTLGLLDFIRSRLMVQAGVDMDQTYGSKVLNQMLMAKTRINKEHYDQGMTDINRLRNYLGSNAAFSFFDMPWVPVYLFIIYILHPLMGMVATGGAVAIIAIGLFQELITRKTLDNAGAGFSRSQAYLNTAGRNMEAISCLGMTGNIVTHWRDKNNEVINRQTRAGIYAGICQSITKTLRLSMQVAIYGVGAYLTLKNQCTAGAMIAASIIMGRALHPIESCMMTWKTTIEARGSYSRLRGLLMSMEDSENMELPPPKGQLQVKSVSLTLGNRYLLKNISFVLEPGEQMGLIGPSAAGKSTLCRILLGIWPSIGGSVRLDGADIYQWNKDQLGPFIGYLPQNVELLPVTVSENIARMGDVDPEKVFKAAKQAGVHEIILQLPDGYDTIIEDGGINLSGGQRQMIGLARALYGDPKLVVLDEPSLNLDRRAEMNLQDVLSLLRRRQTTSIIVSHHLPLLQYTDKLMVMDEGTPQMYGPRKEILNRINPN